MINQVNTLNTGSKLYATQNNLHAQKEASDPVKIQAASVVELQGSMSGVSQVREANALDAASANSVALDIASLLGTHSGSVQENLNGFDAARLLAD